MDPADSIRRLNCLGWKVLGDRQANGRWVVTLESCGHQIVAIANRHERVWLLACDAAMKATMNQWVLVYRQRRNTRIMQKLAKKAY